MSSEKPVSIDEKTARLIEEMDKSLHNMEQTLGMDHIVLAKLLDSYAQLLRQNNIRHLDALNMEARAKAIRAKHNQQEAEKQTAGIESSKVQQSSSLKAGHLRLLMWVFCILVAGGIGFGAMDLIKKSGHLAKMKLFTTKKIAADNETDLQKRPLINDSNPDNTSATPGQAPDSPEGSASSQADEQSDEEQSDNKDNKDQPNRPIVLQGQIPGTFTIIKRGGPQQSQQAQQEPAKRGPNLIEIGERILRIKTLAKQNLAIGLAAEQEKDFQKATDAYQQVIQVVQTAPAQVGRPVYSDEIAQCFEGYARMAELDGHPDVARQWEEAAADVRTHMSE